MPFRFMRKKSKKRAQRSFSYSLPTTDPKKAKMAAELKNKEHEVGKERRDSQDDVLTQIFDSIKDLGDRMESKIEQLQSDMECFQHEVEKNVGDLKTTVSSVEKSLEEAWTRIDDQATELKVYKDVKDSQQWEIDKRKTELQKTTLLLHAERKTTSP